MATDEGRIKAAINSIKALDYQEYGTKQVLSHLGALLWSVRKHQAEREKDRQKAPALESREQKFLRCAADYQDVPLGTVLYKRFGSGWWKKVHDAWIDENGTVMPGAHIATAPREVRKWGDL
jgi:hypothetical protein